MNDQQAFLSSLHDAQHVSIQLSQHSSPQNTLQQVFRLELSSSSSSSTSSSIKVVVEQEGIRNPASSWPCYSYTVHPLLTDFMMRQLLPAMQQSCCSTAALQSLTLSGCGRVEGFYPALLRLMATSSSSQFLSLHIPHWTDFYTSCQNDALLLSQVFGKLQHLRVHQYKLVQSQTASLGLVLGYATQLKSLHITTTGSNNASFLKSVSHGISQLQELQELTCLSTTTTVLDDEDANILCSSIASRPLLRKLELSGVQPLCLTTLLSSTAQPQQDQELTSLTLHHMTKDCATVLGQYLQQSASASLQELQISFTQEQQQQDEDGAVVDLLQGVLRHAGLTRLTLHGISMDHNVAKTLQMVCTYNTTLTELNIAVAASDDENNMLNGDAIMESSHVQDIFMGLVSNTTLTTVVLALHNDDGNKATTPTMALDQYTALALCDVLHTNSTLQHLELPQLQLRVDDTDDCDAIALHVAEHLAANTSLTKLYGLDMVTHYPDLLVQVLHHNKVLEDMHSSPGSTTKNDESDLVSLLLLLNRLGRQHWIEPNGFDVQQLLPLVLAKAHNTPSSIHAILQTCLSYYFHPTASTTNNSDSHHHAAASTTRTT